MVDRLFLLDDADNLVQQCAIPPKPDHAKPGCRLGRASLFRVGYRLPHRKVLLFERFSFFDSVGNRVASPLLFARSPGWTNVAMADGSVRFQSMSAIQTLADSTDSAIFRVFRPSGRWFANRNTVSGFDFYTDGLETPTFSPWAYFWATRNGLAGRDIDRTGLARQVESERLMRFGRERAAVESHAAVR